MMIKKIGGKSNLKCSCGAQRYPYRKLCPACWSRQNEGGRRNKFGYVVNNLLPKNLWIAITFAAQMIREGSDRVRAINIAANYYDESYDDVQSGLSQRSGLSRRGKKRYR